MEDKPFMKDKENKILEEIKRHNSVLMEHMEQQVKTVAEQHVSLKTEIKEEISQLRNSMEYSGRLFSDQLLGRKSSIG